MIVHIFNSSLVSGPETLVMPALVSIKNQIKVILLAETRLPAGTKKVKEFAESLGLDVVEISVRRRLDLQAVSELAQCLKTFNAKVVHAHDVKASFYALRASQKSGEKKPKLVSTHHGIHARSGFLVRVYERYYVSVILPQFDRVLTVCSSDRALLLKRGLRPEKVIVHLNGVDRDPIEPSWREALHRKIIARWGFAEAIHSSTRVFGVVARLAPEKRHQTILEVMLALRVQHPDFSWILLCFGSGPLEAKLKSFTQEHGLDSQVKWMGYREGLSAEMAGFDVLLSLSQGEGLPINVLEAGWAATPIFASAVDGLNDLILGGEGHLVPPGASPSHLADQLFEFSKDRASLELVGKKFLERVSQNFSGKIWLENLQKIYDEL